MAKRKQKIEEVKPFRLHSGKAYGERAFNNEFTDGTINDDGDNLIVHSREKGKGKREVFPKQKGHTALSVYAKTSKTKKLFEPTKHKK